MASGKVKWFNPDKGYGFIEPDEKGPDVFIHNTTLQRCGITVLSEGTAVTFEAEQAAKGLKVTSIAIAR